MLKIVLLILAAVIAVGSAGMTGALQDVDYNTDEGAQNALNFSVAQHNRGTNDVYLSQVADVIKFQRQVVSGMKYIITVRMVKTLCRKDSVNEECTIHQDGTLAPPYQCTFTVWSKPWLNDIQLLKQTC